jgi:IS605 OrfB family transposase
MLRAHKIRLHPTPEQTTYFEQATGTARFVFNWGLEHWKNQYEAGGKPSALALKKQFNAIKEAQFPWVYLVSKSVVEGAFQDLGAAFTNFFDGLKTGRKVGYPQFKSKKRSKASFYLANDRFTVGDHWIDMSKLGRVNMAETLRLEGKILAARISKWAKWWFVSIAVQLPDDVPLNANPPAGLDVGLLRLGTLSDGRWFENQKPLRNLLKQLKRLHRSLSRKPKGSKNYEKARLKLATVYYRIACIRDDILHKMTTEIARTSGLVGVEDLNVKGMMHNRKLALSLQDAALGRLLDLLASKVQTAGGTLIKVDRFFPSSKACSQCGWKHDHLTLADRTFCCGNPACAQVIDRDFNAAINILKEAVRLYGLNSPSR